MQKALGLAVAALVIVAAGCGGDEDGDTVGSGGIADSGGPGGAGSRDTVLYTSDAGKETALPGQGEADGGQPDSALSAGDSGIDSSLDAARTEACIEYVRAYCERNIECLGWSVSVLSCLAANARYCPDQLFSPGSAWTVEAALECAEKRRVMACDAVEHQIMPDCPAAVGTRAAGEECLFANQCASGACSYLGSDFFCGTCIRPASKGDPCSGNCVPPLVCDEETERCVARLQVGEECDPTRSECLPYVCVADSDGGLGRCQPYPTLGEDCSQTLACALGDSYCASGKTCRAYPGPGEECGVDARRSEPGYCAAGFFCDKSLDPPLCIPLPRAGEPCVNGFGDSITCADNSFCDSTAASPVCISLPWAGEPCETGCAGDLICDCVDDACTSRTCIRLRLPGETCVEAYDACLEEASVCQNGTCVAVGQLGLFEMTCGAEVTGIRPW